jgi:O-antigen/teichoic acid export membrane protein
MTPSAKSKPNHDANAAAPTGTEEKQLGSRALSGMVFSGAAMLVLKLSGFLLHLALGWLLLKEDFKLYGMAVSLMTISSAFRDGGASRILIQKGNSARESIRSIASFCLVFNIAAATALLIAIPFAVRFFDEPRIVPLITVLAIATACTTPITVGRARLSIDMRFLELARFDTIVGVTRTLLTLCFAYAGMGAMSFVAPQLMVVLLGWGMLTLMVGPLPAGDAISRTTFWETFRDGRWLMLAAFAGSLATTGDYLVLGRWGKHLLSDYFFGFQITVFVSSMFAPVMNQVMLPTFTKIKDQPTRLSAAFRKVVGGSILFGSTASIGLALIAPALVHFAWQGKWDSAIVVVQVMSINLCIRLLAPLYSSLLQAKGQWSTFAISFLLEAIIVLFAAFTATQMEMSLFGLAVMIAVFRSITPPIYFWYCSRLLDLSSAPLLIEAAKSMAAPMAAGIVALLVARIFDFDPHALPDCLIRVTTFLIVMATITLVAFREPVQAAFGMLNLGNRLATSKT